MSSADAVLCSTSVLQTRSDTGRVRNLALDKRARRCCSAKCFEKYSHLIPHTVDEKFEPERCKPSVVKEFLLSNDLYRGSGETEFVVHFKGGLEQAVCRAFFGACFNIPDNVMIFLVNNHGFTKNRLAKIKADSDMCLGTEAQNFKILAHSFSLGRFFADSKKIAELCVDEKLCRTKKLGSKHEECDLWKSSGSLYAAMFSREHGTVEPQYLGCMWRTHGPLQQPQQNVHEERRPVTIKDAKAKMQKVARAFAQYDSALSSVHKFGRLPAPFTEEALAMMFFYENSVRTVQMVRDMCAQNRLLCYERPQSFQDGIACYQPLGNSSLTRLVNRFKKTQWIAEEFEPMFANPRFRSLLGICASHAQERLIEGLTISTTVSMVGARAAATTYSSLEMAMLNTLVPSHGNIWVRRDCDTAFAQDLHHNHDQVFASYQKGRGAHVQVLEGRHCGDFSLVLWCAIVSAISSLFENFYAEQAACEEVNAKIFCLVHHTFVIRSSLLMHLGGEAQRFAAMALHELTRRCSALNKSTLYVLDLQWHFLPLENLGVWFAPHALGCGLEELLNYGPAFSSSQHFPALVEHALSNVKSSYVTRSEAEQRAIKRPTKEGMLCTKKFKWKHSAAMNARCIGRGIAPDSVARFDAAVFTATYLPSVHLKMKPERMEKQARVVLQMCRLAAQHGVENQATMVVQFPDTSGTAAAMGEKDLIEAAKAKTPGKPLVEQLFELACSRTLDSPWFSWSDFSSFPTSEGDERSESSASPSFFFDEISNEAAEALIIPTVTRQTCLYDVTCKVTASRKRKRKATNEQAAE